MRFDRLERVEGIKQGFAQSQDSAADGWEWMRQSAAGALMHFRPGESANLPAHGNRWEREM